MPLREIAIRAMPVIEDPKKALDFKSAPPSKVKAPEQIRRFLAYELSQGLMLKSLSHPAAV
ncbi:MAG: hypothetical protein LBU32_20075 [Clostridiales bacterium]|nr:hypothetical protein [Clostridiales bacterium]